KTTLNSKALAEMLGRLKSEDSLSVIFTGDTVVGGSFKTVNGKPVESKVITLAESAGIQALTAVATVKDVVRVKVTMKATSADKAKEIEKLITNGLQTAARHAGNEVPHLAKALQTVKILRNEATLTLKGQGSGEAVRELFVGWFTPRLSSRPPKDQPVKKGKP